jgi:hypothetical protein
MSTVRLSQYSKIALHAESASFATSASYASNAAPISIKDEGSIIVATPSSINFIGTGVTVTDAGGGQASVTIPGAGGSAFPYTGSAIITGSLVVTGSTTSTLGFTGSLFGTASLSLTASYINGGTF